ncbi:hypothetical protein [Lentzea sp.]|uniref:hypothetical protein n=1 Tax=Lentzea sp. TaxID=56099 RepID=UPI002CEAA6E2|nr:hypothetical protein [Lentzea sp.]HUQ55332.1 hypothetical protein [Lentzea sp.]
MPGKAHFAELTGNAAVRDQVRTFVRESSPPPAFLDRWLMPIGGGVLLFALVVAGVVVFRERSARSTTTAVDS